MKHLFASLIIASSLSSCTMTGDPSEGGLFSWSPRMSNDRIEARRQYNEDIKADSRDQNARANYLKRQMNQKDAPDPDASTKSQMKAQDVPDPDVLRRPEYLKSQMRP
jgi:hypothetical protein